MSQAERPLGSPGHLPRGLALRHSDHSLGTRERTHTHKIDTCWATIIYSNKHSQRNFQRHFPSSTISPVFGIQHGVRMLSTPNPLEFIIFRIKWRKISINACRLWQTQHVFQSLDCPDILSKLMHFKSDKRQGFMMTHSCELNFLSCVNLEV